MATVMRLTKRAIEALPRAETDGKITYRDEEEPFLHLVSNSTGLVWRYIRWWQGRTVFITVGKYPNVTPDQAREESRKISAGYTTGGNPQEERKAQRSVLTWPELFEWYMEHHSRNKKKTSKVDEQQEARYCGAWKGRRWDTLTRDAIRQWHEKITKDNGAFGADRALALVRAVFNRAYDDEVIRFDRNPTHGVKMNHADFMAYGRTRFLQGDEVPRLFIALDEYHDQNMADFFRLCILTGARKGNVQSMRWEDFSTTTGTWTIPAVHSKNKRLMTVTLLPMAMEVLNRRYLERKSEEWVFPSKFTETKTGHITEPKTAWKSVCKLAKITDVRIHDLRRTMGSWQAMTGASLSVIGKSLGHASQSVTQIYARLNDDPVRLSMQKALTAMLGQGEDKKEGVE